MPIRRRYLIQMADGTQVPPATDEPFISRPNAEAMVAILRRAGQRPVALIGARFRRGTQPQDLWAVKGAERARRV